MCSQCEEWRDNGAKDSGVDVDSPNAMGLNQRSRNILESSSAEKEQRSADGTPHKSMVEQGSAAGGVSGSDARGLDTTVSGLLSFIVEGLLSTGPTPSSFYLLVEIGLNIWNEINDI